MSNLSEQDLKACLRNIELYLEADPSNQKCLATELDTAAKHIPAYTKIIKNHIEQLRKVLELENHNHRTLESAGLSSSVQQLIQLFNALEDDDLQIIEDLALAAANWQTEDDLRGVIHKVESTETTIS